MKKLFVLLLITPLFLPKIVSAHCPLCTVGAGSLAVLAAYLGVSTVVVGVMIGAFSLALSLWLAPLIKRQYIQYQKQILIIIIYLGTVIPIMPLIQHYGPLYVSFFGQYGSLFHNTYTINLYILGVIIGTLIMFISPFISKIITKTRGHQIPYQGISITILLLVLISLIIQFWP